MTTSISRQPARRWPSIVLLIGGLLTYTATAFAQGPLTGALPEEAPATVGFRVGPFQLSPNFGISELGVDTNVFDEPVDPKRDYMVVVSPTMNVYVRSGLVQFVLASGTDFTYYANFKTERSMARQMRGRLDFLFSRFRPSVAAAMVDSRRRPNAEIDLRAKRNEKEVSASIGFELSPLARLYGGVARVDSTYKEGDVFRGIALDDALNRRGEQMGGGVRLAATPFTTVTIEMLLSRDRFVHSPLRDSDSLTTTALIAFSSAAVVNGSVKIGFRDFRPKDPTVEGFKGLTTIANLSYQAFWQGRLSVTAERDVQYSFEEAEGYFVGTSGGVTYTQRIGGPFDVQAQYGTGAMSYGRKEEAEPRVDRTFTYAAGVGYNRTGGARIGVTYELGQRQSAERPDRRYSRRRIYGSLTYSL